MATGQWWTIPPKVKTDPGKNGVEVPNLCLPQRVKVCPDAYQPFVIQSYRMSLSQRASAPKAAGHKSVGTKSAGAKTAENAVHDAARAAFLSQIEPLLLSDPAPFAFPGAIRQPDAEAFWRWLTRDVSPELNDEIAARLAKGESHFELFLALAPKIAGAVHDVFDAAAKTPGETHRLTVQMGGEDVRAAVPPLLLALKSLRLIDKAAAFGRATNAMTEDAALALAFKAMPLGDSAQASFLLLVAISQAAYPGRLMSAIVSDVGRTDEHAIGSAGYGPLLDALLAHAQNQLSALGPSYGLFADIDLVCRSVNRFHRLVRAVAAYVELERGGFRAHVISSLTKTVSERLEPRLRTVPADVVQSLRQPREGNDRANVDLLLSALNGMYLLSAVREARGSLALNALLDQVWKETGQGLEMLIERNLDQLRRSPGDAAASTRLEYGIKMARLRFGDEFADALEKAFQTQQRRGQL